VNPDEFLVFKPTLSTTRPILEKRLGSKEIRMIYDIGGGKNVKNIPVALCDRQVYCLNDDQVHILFHSIVSNSCRFSISPNGQL
jgi:pyruvate,water dikinase